jgi:hypothetical protein
MMEDAIGNELLATRAERNYFAFVKRDSLTEIGRNLTVNVVGHQTQSIQGNSSGSVGGDFEMFTKGVVKWVADGDMTFQSVGTLHLYAATRDDWTSGLHMIRADRVEMEAGDIEIRAKSELRLTCGGSVIVLTPGGIQITAAGEVAVNGAVVKLNCD